MRLIDADALLERIAKRKQEVHDQSFAPNPYRDAYDCCRFDELNIVRNMTRNARTVDPVKHGRWIQAGQPNRHSEAIYRCSICNYIDMAPVFDTNNFCANCGAKMDGDKDAGA